MTTSISVEERRWNINVKVKFEINSTPFPTAGMSKVAKQTIFKTRGQLLEYKW
jgi:hypothetical protein